MRLQLLNKQIIDEREEGLANKAGAETAGFLFLALTVFSVGSIFTSKVGLSPIDGGSLTHRLRIVLLCSLSTIGCEIYQL